MCALHALKRLRQKVGFNNTPAPQERTAPVEAGFEVIRLALVSAGVEFIDENGGGAGGPSEKIAINQNAKMTSAPCGPRTQGDVVVGPQAVRAAQRQLGWRQRESQQPSVGLSQDAGLEERMYVAVHPAAGSLAVRRRPTRRSTPTLCGQELEQKLRLGEAEKLMREPCLFQAPAAVLQSLQLASRRFR